jgi:U3 small nucleolar RNA-associated protein 21
MSLPRSIQIEEEETKEGKDGEVSEEESEEEDDDLEETKENGTRGDEMEINKGEEGQLSKDLITYSELPKSKWQNLSNIDVIKKRNKPKEPPKKPEKAPFFLPTLPGLEPTFLKQKKEDDDRPSSNSRVLNFQDLETKTKFVLLLEDGKCKRVSFIEMYGINSFFIFSF